MGRLRILHTNDLHGALDRPLLAPLLEARASADLYFDCGDAIKTGNLGIPLKPDPVWPMLAEAGVSATVPGNRESHVLASVVDTKTAGAEHPVLCANWFRNDGSLRFKDSVILEVSGLRVGVFGVMVPMVTERMATRKASQFVWHDPIQTATDVTSRLRSEVDIVIALTHIGLPQDKKLAAACPGIDVILGGHSHTVLNQPERVGKTLIFQTGSHARYLGLYELETGSGKVDCSHCELIPWRVAK